eukprot:26105_5
MCGTYLGCLTTKTSHNCSAMSSLDFGMSQLRTFSNTIFVPIDHSSIELGLLSFDKKSSKYIKRMCGNRTSGVTMKLLV